MRRFGATVLCAALLLGACGGGGKRTSATTATGASSTAVSTSTTVAPTTTAPCPPAPPIPSGPVTSPTTGASQQLTALSITSDACFDHVVLDFTSRSADPPTYRIEYKPGPFSHAESGEPLAVAGRTFLVVRLQPASGFDPETGSPTYTGPRRVEAAGAHHVTEVVNSDDFEGVMTWIVGLDDSRAFTVEATGVPQHRLTVTIW